MELDTLIVAIGERPESGAFAAMGLAVDSGGRVVADRATLATSVKGVFAGGDVVTGPNTVVDAIAAGKKAARVIDRYLRGAELKEPAVPKLPTVFIEQVEVEQEELEAASRAVPPVLPVEKRVKNFNEIEKPLSEEQARAETRRCLRCDLAFTRDSQSCEAQATIAGSEST
jgi:NADH-quinone oxidoreductase subunit F